jgi:hypothetical protein
VVNEPTPAPAAGGGPAAGGRLAAWAAVVVPPLVVAALVVLAVAPGLAPDVAYWDTGEFQTVLPVLGTAHPTGYPTYVLLGFVVNLLLTPFGEPAFRMNILSLLCVAVAAGVTVRLTARLTGSVPVAMAVGLGLALTPDVWRVATHADPHTLHLALVAVVFGLLVRWEAARRDADRGADRWLAAAAVAFGLAVGNHSLTLLLALPIGLYVLAVHPGIVLRPRLVAGCALALVATVVLVYLELPLRAGPFRAPLVYARPETWDGFWYVALAEQFRGSLVDPLGNLPGKLGDLVHLAVAQYGLLAGLIPVGFLATVLRHPRLALLTGSAMVVTAIFNASYVNADISRYYLGPLLWGWLWVGVLAGLLIEIATGSRPDDDEQPREEPREARPADLPAPPATPAAGRVRGSLPALAVGTILALALLYPTAAAFGDRAARADEHGNSGPRQWVEAVLGEVEPDAVIVSWWSASTVLWYAQYVDHRRSDITVIDDRTRLDLGYGEATDVIARFYGSRPVYVIRANADDLGKVLALYDLEALKSVPAMGVYRVLGPRGEGG